MPSAEVAIQTVTAAVHLYLGTTIGRLRFDVGAGTRWGWVHVTGRPLAGRDAGGKQRHRDLWRTRAARARRLPRKRTPLPLIAVEVGAGLVARPMRGLRDGTERVYAVEGTWVSLSAASASDSSAPARKVL